MHNENKILELIDQILANRPGDQNLIDARILVQKSISAQTPKKIVIRDTTPPIQDQPKQITIYFDGASRGNPGLAGIGVIAKNRDNVVLWTVSEYIGDKVTNNVAEYTALIKALTKASQEGYRNLIICGDSELVVRQVNGKYKVKNAGLKPLYQQCRELIDKFDNVLINHVLRDQNKEADLLANQGIDG